jgi:H+/gluconate symporter-like permease
MWVAYRGQSVILFAPLCALLGVLLSNRPAHLLPFHSSVFMATLADFVQRHFTVFLLGAVFGKLIDLSGTAASISKAVVALLGSRRAILAVVLACGVLTYGGVSLFVVAFAVYPFAASLFREANLPKRLIPGTIALGSFTFTIGYARILPTVKAGRAHAIDGALLATMNTAAQCGFGSVIASLAGFVTVKTVIKTVAVFLVIAFYGLTHLA